jgi:pimeloyl-ACP methyl ester carboxylesterase
LPTLNARGVELAWEAQGSDPTVALVHETGATSAAWRPLAEELAAAGARALRYDRRGWGASGAPEGYRRTTIEEHSEDLAELIGADAPPALACGAGIGAVIALDLLLRRPEILNGAVLVEPDLPGLVPAATEAISEDRDALIDAANEGGLEAVVALYRAGALSGLAPGGDRLPGEPGDAVGERASSLVAELGASAVWSMPLRRLAANERPVAIVTSAGTPPALAERAEAIASRLGRARSETVSGEGPPHLGAPEALARIVLELR